jgi:hypothetical protein
MDVPSGVAASPTEIGMIFASPVRVSYSRVLSPCGGRAQPGAELITVPKMITPAVSSLLTEISKLIAL